jgi:hypothetical protein
MGIELGSLVTESMTEAEARTPYPLIKVTLAIAQPTSGPTRVASGSTSWMTDRAPMIWVS